MTVETSSSLDASGTRVPLISIGLPVYNGARHIERALDTLLAQSFRDFDLVVSDNASTDGTVAICERYAVCDARVRIDRSPVNRGAAWNFNHVAEGAKGELFAWAAHDDEWQPDFLKKCSDELLRNPQAVCCYTRYQPIDDRGNLHSQLGGWGCQGRSRRTRWNHVLHHWEVHGAVFGLMRTAVLRRTRGALARTSADLIFMSELILHGNVVVLPEVLHRKRMPSDGSFRSTEEVLIAVGGSVKGANLFNRYHVLREEIAGLRHAALPVDEERELIRDAWIHYLISMNWRHDSIDSARELVRRARRSWLGSQVGSLAEVLKPSVRQQ